MTPQEIFQYRDPRWFEDQVTMIFSISAATISVIFFFVMGEALLAAFIVAALIFMLGFAAMIVFMERYNGARRATIFGRFEKLDRSLLVQLTSSPEVGDEGRTLATQFLNDRHPGWSLDLSTVNTTR